jgi:acetoin utilization protein AcuB
MSHYVTTPIHRRVRIAADGARRERVYARCPAGTWEPIDHCRQCGACAHLSTPEDPDSWLLVCETPPTPRRRARALAAEGPRVSEAMDPSVLCVASNVAIEDVARVMRDDRYDVAVVVDTEDRPIGIVAPSDLCGGSTAGEAMTPFATSLLEGAAASYARSLACDGALEHIPILSAGHVMGLASPLSLLVSLCRHPLSRSQTMKTPRTKPRTIADCMTRAPHSIGVEQSLETAHTMMRTHGIRHLPVLAGGKLVGLLSQRDLYLIETLDRLDTKTVRVDEAMSQEAYVVEPSEPLASVAATMAEKKLGCAVVMDHGKVVGVFTTVDALRLLAG